MRFMKCWTLALWSLCQLYELLGIFVYAGHDQATNSAVEIDSVSAEEPQQAATETNNEKAAEFR